MKKKECHVSVCYIWECMCILIALVGIKYVDLDVCFALTRIFSQNSHLIVLDKQVDIRLIGVEEPINDAVCRYGKCSLHNS